MVDIDDNSYVRADVETRTVNLCGVCGLYCLRPCRTSSRPPSIDARVAGSLAVSHDFRHVAHWERALVPVVLGARAFFCVHETGVDRFHAVKDGKGTIASKRMDL